VRAPQRGEHPPQDFFSPTVDAADTHCCNYVPVINGRMNNMWWRWGDEDRGSAQDVGHRVVRLQPVGQPFVALFAVT